jgi:hypothetical protein
MARDVEKEMLSARDTSKGTMEIWVLFDTVEQVEQAKEWMKGKQKVKTLVPMTGLEAEKRQEKRKKEIAKHYGIKLG